MENIELKVGDVLESSWGYDQTNVNFFQVVALRGKTQCVIREIGSRPVKNDSVSPAVDMFVKRPIFCKFEGSVKKINYYQGRPSVTLSTFAVADLCDSNHVSYETPWYQAR